MRRFPDPPYLLPIFVFRRLRGFPLWGQEMGNRVGPEGRPLTPAPNMCFFVPLTVAVVSFVTLISLGLGGWPTETGLSAFGFCESLLDGIVKQRANTWSNLSFTAVGLLIGLRAWLDLEPGAQ